MPARKSRRKPKKKNKPKARHRSFRRWIGYGALGMFGLTAAIVLIYGFWASTLDIDAVKEIPQRSTVYDYDGKLYSRLQGENRIVVPRSGVSPQFVEALLAREDTRFFSHHGVDPIGVVRAIVRNLTAKTTKQGASTLTQQLARNTYPLGGKTVHRKILEAFVAARIEQYYSKQEILEYYMNRIYFGGGVYGVETASLRHFGKHAKDLTLGEAAMLAGIIRAPSHYAPQTNLKGALAQRDQVLTRLETLGKISPAEAAAAKKAKISISKRGKLSLQENYAMEAVREDLERLLTDEQQAVGGFQIYTTIDPVLQRAAESSLDTRLRKIEQSDGYAHPKRANFGAMSDEDKQQTPYLQGAVMVIDNATGGVRAIVGGRNYAESQYNRAREAERQVGSTFKPFVYAAAFGRGMLPGARISDNRLEPGEIAAAPTWNPGNSDGKFQGLMPAAAGLIESRNTMSIRVGERATLNEVVRVGRAAGLPSVPARPGIYLGDFETTLWDLTSAYTVFPNRGVERPAYLIERIDNSLGETIYQAPRVAPQALDPGACWLTTSVLEAVMERGTGASVKALGFKRNCGGKTGTTNEYRDAWFVGFTTSLTCGVWVGLDQPKTIVPRGYGATLALPVWADIMGAASIRQYPAKDFSPPGGLREVEVCSMSNELATSACEGAGTAYRTELPPSRVPNDPCHVHQGSVVSNPPPRATKAQNPAQGLLRSFRKFFGGK